MQKSHGPSGGRMEKMNESETKEFENWLQMWVKYTGEGGSKVPVVIPSESVKRKLMSGPMRHVMTEFLIPRARPDEWLKEHRQNVYVKEQTDASTCQKRNEKTKAHEKLMENNRNELEELTRLELEEMKIVQEKINVLQDASGKDLHSEVLLKKKQGHNFSQLMQKVDFLLKSLNRKEQEILEKETKDSLSPDEGNAEVELDVMQRDILNAFFQMISESQKPINLAAFESSQELEIASKLLVHVEALRKLASCPGEVYTWFTENREKGAGWLQNQQSSAPGITELDETVSRWCRLHLELRQENKKLRNEIAAIPPPKLENANRRAEQIHMLLVERELLKENIKFCQSFQAETHAQKVIGKISRDFDPEIPSGVDPENINMVEEQFIGLVKTWASCKAGLKQTQTVTRELHSVMLPKSAQNLEEIVQFRVQD